MIYVSFVEILAEAHLDLIGFLGEARGTWVTIIAFFSGMGLIAVIDRLVPEVENPHEARHVELMNVVPGQKACDNTKWPDGWHGHYGRQLATVCLRVGLVDCPAFRFSVL